MRGLAMMRSILVYECIARQIPADSHGGEKLSSVILAANLRGVTDPAGLKAIARDTSINYDDGLP